MDLEEIGNNEGNWIDSAQDSNYWRALVNAALNLRVTLGVRQLLWPQVVKKERAGRPRYTPINSTINPFSAFFSPITITRG